MVLVPGEAAARGRTGLGRNHPGGATSASALAEGAAQHAGRFAGPPIGPGSDRVGAAHGSGEGMALEHGGAESGEHQRSAARPPDVQCGDDGHRLGRERRVERRGAHDTAQDQRDAARTPPPINKDQYLNARRLLRQHPKEEVFLLLMWSFAARAADIGGLQMEDLHVKGCSVAATIRRGKGAKFRGPYPVATTMAAEDAALLRRHCAQHRPADRLFLDLASVRAAVSSALRRTLPGACLPSVRKGAARHLVAHGVPEAEVARLTGHTRLDTLRRYLGYAENLTTEAREAQQRTVLLAPGPRPEAEIVTGEGRGHHPLQKIAAVAPPLLPSSASETRTSGERSARSKVFRPGSGGTGTPGPCT